MSYFAHKLSIYTVTLSLVTITNGLFVNQAQAISSSDVREVINYTLRWLRFNANS